jgi:tetratricopeptide (TPR) repeat protein
LLIVAALFLGGEEGDGAMPWLGVGAAVLIVVLVATRGLPRGAWALLPLCALAIWCAASISWSIQPDRTWAYANRALVYAAFAIVGLYLADRLVELALGLCGALGALFAWSLAGKALPGLHDYGVTARLVGPVGYWNALALLGDIALPLGLWLAGRSRAAGALLVFGAMVTIALTFSRGGAIVGLIVVAAWIGLSRLWVEAASTLVAACVPAAVLVGVSFALPGITSDGQPHATRMHDGVVFGILLLAGLALTVVLSHLPVPEPTPALRRAALGAVAVLAVLAIVGGATHARTAWNGFTSSAEVSNGPNRILSANSNHRWVWWKEGWRAWKLHPLAGTGAGSFDFTNLRYRTSNIDVTTEPHDLPVQFLSETGVVGLALFAAAAAALLFAARRKELVELALALALPAYLMHGLVDIDWEFVAVTGPILLIAGALAGRPAAETRPSGFGALLASGVAVALVASLFAVWLGNRWAGEAAASLDRPAHAISLAKRARSIDPLALAPIYAQAFAEEERGQQAPTEQQRNAAYAEALKLLRKATELQPENAQAWFLRGDLLLELGCPRAALSLLDRFTELNPQDPGNKEYDRALALVNTGGAAAPC